MKNKFVAGNVLISVIVISFVLLGVLGLFAYGEPTALSEATGRLSELEYRDDSWLDYIFGYSGNEYLHIRLDDGRFFEATGICYDLVDRSLFEELAEGEEVTLLYDDEHGRPDRIYGIRHGGKEYLSLSDVLKEFERNTGIMRIACPILIAVTLALGAVGFVLNYKKYRR